jgi:fucose permease
VGISAVGCLLMSILGMLLPVGNNHCVLARLLLLTSFEGPFFLTIFAVTLRGLGRHTKLVATGFTMAISGVLVWTSVTWAVQQADGGGGDPRYAMCTYAALHAGVLVIVGIINLQPTIRR